MTPRRLDHSDRPPSLQSPAFRALQRFGFSFRGAIGRATSCFVGADSVCLSANHVGGRVCGNQRVSRHAAPRGKVGRRTRALRDHLERVSRRDVEDPPAKLEDELPASHVTGIPVVFHRAITAVTLSQVKTRDGRRRASQSCISSRAFAKTGGV